MPPVLLLVRPLLNLFSCQFVYLSGNWSNSSVNRLCYVDSAFAFEFLESDSNLLRVYSDQPRHMVAFFASGSPDPVACIAPVRFLDGYKPMHGRAKSVCFGSAGLCHMDSALLLLLLDSGSMLRRVKP